ncbi:dihydroorotate dehydrogenase electron transfer subunit [Nocardioides euryhalodurans]|uniref:Dihydroorotate dehydrogenase electron transfer subunit n=1 Tax=Nocardioides euryhalodurans TaxID=2518370 RepID=A0A4P7GPW7_9ACTN|nr:dihydroorotate dehydrogenase electron transfer subunit [Nocardioides euryhalodurans]
MAAPDPAGPAVSAPAPERTPLHVTGELLASRRIGAHHHLTLVAPGIAERFRPGTFVALDTGPERLARRAFWIHKVKTTGGYGATLELVVEARGAGTEWLVSQPAGTRLAVTGPLGRAFSLPRETVPCLLVGEGYAAAPLFPLAERLRERDCAVSLLVAGEDEAHLLSALEARRSARSVTVVTRDGTVGQRGSVADVVDEVLQRSGAAVVYAAGSTPTLHAVAQAAERAGAWSQVALEQPLTCATGLCGGCPVPVVGESGSARLVRACADGPVLRGDRVLWDQLAGAS